MKNVKPVRMHLANHFKIIKRLYPITKEEKEQMAFVPYSYTVGSVRYDMVYARSNIAQAVGLISRLLSNSGKDHWEVEK